MAQISSNPIIGQFDPYSYGTVAIADVGQLMFGDSGKAFRFCYNATPALVVGNAIQSSANTTITDFDGLAVATAAAKGDTKVVLTNGNTAVTAGMLVGGSFVVSTSSTASANIGEEYTIIDHSTASGAGSLTVYLDTPLRTALTTATTTVALRKSPYYGVIQGTGGAATGTPVGIAIAPIPAANYGWLQTKGVCGALSDGSTFAVGSLVGPSVATAGAVGVFVAGTARTYIGFSMSAANSTHAISVQLTID
jgi:hypothetical protein